MKRKSNKLIFALVGLSAIALSNGPMRAADFNDPAPNQVALIDPNILRITGGLLLVALAQFSGPQLAAVIDSSYSIGSKYLGEMARLFGYNKAISLMEGSGFRALKRAI